MHNHSALEKLSCFSIESCQASVSLDGVRTPQNLLSERGGRLNPRTCTYVQNVMRQSTPPLRYTHPLPNPVMEFVPRNEYPHLPLFNCGNPRLFTLGPLLGGTD